MRRLDWEDLKVFVALARAGSMRGAASQLGVHASTVNRRVDQLERRLGVRLFERRGNAWPLTDAGSSLMTSVHRVETEIDGIERQLLGMDDRMQGDIRVSLPDVLATSFLVRDLVVFCEQYPDVSLEFIPSYEIVDLGKREADVAIRVTTAPPEHLVGRKLGEFAYCAYASPEYLRSHDPMKWPQRCRWLGWSHDREGNREFREHWYPKVPVGNRLRSLVLQAEAAAAGMGMAVLPCGAGDSDPRLVRVPPSEPRVAGELWLLTHPDLARSARIREFMDCVSQSFRNHRDMMLGLRGE